jgi:5-formyltetrahydrofolate cyclo-ligase
MKHLKDPLRREMRARLRAEAPGLQRRSELLRAHILKDPVWETARTVGLFCPLPEEPDLLALMAAENKRYVFPRIVGEELVWHEVLETSELKANTALGLERLRQPVGGEAVALAEIDLLLVPGLAFTLEGGRLGRGGGYYDRVLAKFGTGSRVGVCFEFQIVETLPLEKHDLPVDRVCHDGALHGRVASGR